MQTVKKVNSVVYVKERDNRQVVKILGKKYRVRESARIKYEIIGYTLGTIFTVACIYIAYCALWVAGF